MKKNILMLAAAFIIPAATFAQDAATILNKTDNILNAPKDQTLMTQIIITDKSGKTSTREMSLLQKGSDKRLVKFLSPADQKGIGFLSLPGDNLTLWLPAFGKTRKIASNVKNTRFAGTDFSYEDMEAKKYSQKWNPKLISSAGDTYVLELTPKSGIVSEYSKMIMTVRKSDSYPIKIDHYNKAGKLCKTMTTGKIEKSGAYTMAKEMTMTDVLAGTKTKMVITSMKFDTGLSDDKFTERELMK